MHTSRMSVHTSLRGAHRAAGHQSWASHLLPNYAGQRDSGSLVDLTATVGRLVSQIVALDCGHLAAKLINTHECCLLCCYGHSTTWGIATCSGGPS